MENTDGDAFGSDVWKRRAEHFMAEAKRLREENERTRHALYMIQLAIEDVSKSDNSPEDRSSEEQEFVLDRWPDAECVGICHMFIVRSKSHAYATGPYFSSGKAWSAAAAHVLTLVGQQDASADIDQPFSSE
jgi:hypothetical protein